MKDTAKKIGIFAVCGLLSGALAGGAFVGVKTGGEYLVNRLGHNSISSTAMEEAKDDGGKLGQSETDENASETKQGETAGDTAEVNPTVISGEADKKDYDVADLVEETMPSVVSITSLKVTQDPYAYFFGSNGNQTSEGAGSGVIIGEDDERLLIVTNYHVVSNATDLKIGFVNDTSANAKVVGTASSNDLAVVSVVKSDLSADTLSKIKKAEIGDSSTLRVGEEVVAIGNALGFGQSVTVGYLSALSKEVTINNNTLSMLQTDAAINEGNSGGALFDMNGKLIGINAAKATNYDNNVEGMGYAIPISDAAPVIQKILDYTGKMKSGQGAYLGISGKDVTASDAAAFGMPQGVYISEVKTGSPAEAAGLKAGDIIVSVDGGAVTSITDIQSVLIEKMPGDTVEIGISRPEGRGIYSQTLSVTATLEAATN